MSFAFLDDMSERDFDLDNFRRAMLEHELESGRLKEENFKDKTLDAEPF